VISRDEKRDIEVARKYKIRLYTMKLMVFRLLDEGYSPAEVKFILRKFIIPEDYRSFSNTVRRYQSLWKKAQAPKAPGK